MHTIDLLRGEGIPTKATPGSVCLVAVIVAVPILAGAVMGGRYLQNLIVIGIDRQAISTAQETIGRHKADVERKGQIEKKRAAVNAKLAEVKSCLGDRMQWTPMLITLVKEMPKEMVMSGISAEMQQNRRRALRTNDPNQPKDVTRRTLVLDLTGKAGDNYDSIVRAYGERLKQSETLGPRLENVIPEPKLTETGISYTMKLVFKAGT